MGPESDVEVIGDPAQPAVLLLHPWWGITPAVRWWAEQLVGAGRRVLLPDLYGGRTADTIDGAEALADAMDHAAVLRLLERCAEQLASEGQAWAAMGFSLGAFLACHLASRGAAGPRELVLFYGGQPPEGDDVQTKIVELHVVADDEYFTEEELTATEVGFRSHGAVVETCRYEGSRHWFAERDSPAFDEGAAALSLSRVLARLGV